jgi:hypothetical protein
MHRTLIRRARLRTWAIRISVIAVPLWLASAFFHVERTLGRCGTVALGYGSVAVEWPMDEYVYGASPFTDDSFMNVPAGKWGVRVAWPNSLGWLTWGMADWVAGRQTPAWSLPSHPRLAWLPRIAWSQVYPCSINIPIYMVGWLPLIYLAISCGRERLRRGRQQCTMCAYSVRGLPADSVCPECGGR